MEEGEKGIHSDRGRYRVGSYRLAFLASTSLSQSLSPSLSLVSPSARIAAKIKWHRANARVCTDHGDSRFSPTSPRASPIPDPISFLLFLPPIPRIDENKDHRYTEGGCRWIREIIDVAVCSPAGYLLKISSLLLTSLPDI